MMNAVGGGRPLVADPQPRPAGSATSGPSSLTLNAIDYSSASLSWPTVAGATEIQIKIGGSSSYLTLQGSMNRVTIGNLKPGTGYTFTAVAMNADGNQLPGAPSVSGTTKALPGGRTISNLQVVTSAGSSTYKADIVVPYAFTRLYIWDSEEQCDWTNNPGWPINYAVANYVCTHYMVEGETLYKYSGVVSPGTTNAPWSWTSLGSVTVQQTGYTYQWTLPIGTSTTDTSKFVIQVQGYGPKGNVVKPCPLWGGGPDGTLAYCA